MKVSVPDDFPRGRLPDDVVFAGADEVEGIEFAVPTSSAAAERLPELPDLRVVQLLSAGYEWVDDHAPGHVTLCNAGRHALARAQILRHRAGLPLEHVVRRGEPAP